MYSRHRCKSHCSLRRISMTLENYYNLLKNTGYWLNNQNCSQFYRISKKLDILFFCSVNTGAHKGFKSNSYNGFGLGLGAGLTLGYGEGLLAKPVGSDQATFNYDYIHKEREYGEKAPLKCFLADETHLIEKIGGTSNKIQEITIEEAECKDPGSTEPVCFGKVTVTEIEMVKGKNSLSIH